MEMSLGASWGSTRTSSVGLMALSHAPLLALPEAPQLRVVFAPATGLGLGGRGMDHSCSGPSR